MIEPKEASLIVKALIFVHLGVPIAFLIITFAYLVFCVIYSRIDRKTPISLKGMLSLIIGVLIGGGVLSLLSLLNAGDSRAIKPLISVLNEYDHVLCKAAKGALVKIGEPAVEPLISLVKDKNMKRRTVAVEVLGNIGNYRAIGPLIEVREDKEVRNAA